MDISDQQMKQLAAGAPHSFLPLNYMHSLQTVDSFTSSHFPNYNTLHPSLIMNSSNINDTNKAPDTAAAHMSSPCIMYNPGNNMSMASISAGLDQIPGLYKTTFDHYSFNQIYNDPAVHMFNIAGVDPHNNIHSTGKSMDLDHDQKLDYKVPADPNSAAKPIPSSGCLSAAFAPPEASHEDACRLVDSTRKIVKSEPDMDHFAVPSSLLSSISSYPSASTTGTSLLHSLVDMESLKDEAYFDQRRSAFDHIDAVASTSSSASDHHHHFFDFSNLPSFSVKDMNPSIITSHQSIKSNSLHGINEKNTSSNNKALSSHVGTETTIGTPTRCKTQVAPKRRKSQQKRVVCVPAVGGVERPTAECLPSDSWAWRKYGQKPIKNSPYPRSYYKCSSVKGCTARKQVERNPTDPLMIIITYTVEHSHPISSSAAAAAAEQPPKGAHEEEEDDDASDKQCPQPDNKQIMISADGTDAISEESCEPISSEGTYHDICNNEENMIIESAHDIDDHPFVDHHARAYPNDDEAQVGLAVDSKNNEGVSSTQVGLLASSSNYHGTLKKTFSSHDHTAIRGIKAEEDVFSQLDELPDLFGRNQGWPSDTADQGDINSSPSTHINIDPFDLYCWP